MRKMLSMAALMLSVMMVASSSQAATNTYTGTYTGSLAGVGLWYQLGDPDLGDVGGYGFTGTEGDPVSVAVADATGRAVGITVAQDLDGDLTAGEAGEPSQRGCGKSLSLVGSTVPFQAGFPIVVFLYTGANSVTPCAGAATHGTITLTTETAA